MPIARKSTKPAGILNEAGEPEILLEVNGLKLSFTPPATVGDVAEPATEGDGEPEQG